MKRYNKPATMIVKVQIDTLMLPNSPGETPGVETGGVNPEDIDAKQFSGDTDLWED